MGPPTRTIQLQQLLHGYDGGHRLLAGSFELPSAASRRILIQSDLSGALPPKSFQTYLTGYPVKELGAYAFARTWYAPEMPRPGCVWTHTLLIRAEDVPLLEDLSDLQRHFVRPKSGAIPSKLAPIDFEGPQDTASDERSQSQSLEMAGRTLVRSFYSQSNHSIVVPATDPSSLESLFLEVWNQLWPLARMELTISSGSLAARKLDGRPFDLQIVPTALAREIVRASSAETLDLQGIPEFGSEPISPGPRSIVEGDFGQHPPDQFRSFLHDIADETFARPDIYCAASVYLMTEARERWTTDSLRALYQKIAEVFPDAEKATKLKAFSLSLSDALDIPNGDRWLILEMASHGYGDSFSSPNIGLAIRTEKLIQQGASSAIELLYRLFENRLNAFGERISYSIIESLSYDEILGFLKQRRQFVSTFVRLRPLIATNVDFWRSLHGSSHEILESIAAVAREKPEILVSVFPALFNSGLDYEASHFISLFGENAAAAIFSHRGSLPLVLHDRWLDALTARPDVIEKLLSKTSKLTPELLSGIAAVYSPHRATAPNFPLSAWKDGLSSWAPSFSPTLAATVETCSFSLAVAFQLSTELGAQLAVLCFQTSHEAAGMQMMPPTSWSKLEPTVPQISYIKDWDRCERMRRAFIFHFTVGAWPLHYFFATLTQEKVLRDVIDTALYLSAGRELLDRLVDALQSGSIVASPDQINATSQALKLRIQKPRK